MPNNYLMDKEETALDSEIIKIKTKLNLILYKILWTPSKAVYLKQSSRMFLTPIITATQVRSWTVKETCEKVEIKQTYPRWMMTPVRMNNPLKCLDRPWQPKAGPGNHFALVAPGFVVTRRLKTAQNLTSIHCEQNSVWQKRHWLNNQLISAVSVNANEKCTPGWEVCWD